MTTQPHSDQNIQTIQTISTLDNDVAAYLDLTEQIEQLTARRDTIRARIAQRGLGEHTTSTGVTVTVTPPNRRFNLDTALSLLSEQQRDVCRLDGFDPKKVKAQLPPVLLEQAMDDGTGAPRVTIK